MTIRVLLADDQDLLRHGFKMIVNAQTDMETVGEAANGTQAIEQAAALRPDVVLMDVRMPGTDGIEATRHIAAHLPEVKVLILTTFDVDEYAFTGLRAGASGFLLKNVRTEELLAGIRTVARGDAILAPSTTRRLLDAYAGTFHATKEGVPPKDVLSPLTQRERQVFTEMASGLTNQEIADQLVLSETTVKTHVARVLAKLHLRDRVQAVIFAYENGLTTPSN
ncbi:two component transcriptional regulator, LuxR family [Actinacidiphila yanglinensis]|uniref:Two component transcriptional regulator, LuxR family n=1 Tax=Actinacidiphila yanglinensis TaxID=310779 RepID=A0A1H6DFZ1_9ACTN|nr:response regulator transcription factor [Actinacidiphila yanglinensis]SEG84169.1 two component transcriptional regulator, LuxR family [Actinacidiphila yanglinensis]